MKKFNFPLNTVLSYKQQRLDFLQTEHAAILERVRAAEKRLAALNTRYREERLEYQEKCSIGMSITEAKLWESSFRALERDIRGAEAKLEEERRCAEDKRLEVVEAKKETTSIEKLKAKKKMEYQKAETKDAEIFIDEFVSSTQSVANRA